MALKRRHRNSDYKFTEHERSKPGTIALVCGLCSVCLVIIGLNISLSDGAESGVRIGAFGLLGLLTSILGLILAIMGLKEEDTYKGLPKSGLVVSILGLLIWIALIVAGILL